MESKDEAVSTKEVRKVELIVRSVNGEHKHEFLLEDTIRFIIDWALEKFAIHPAQNDRAELIRSKGGVVLEPSKTVKDYDFQKDEIVVLTIHTSAV